MTKTRRPAGRDAFHAVWMVAAEVPLLAMLPGMLTWAKFSYVWVADPSVFGPPGQVLGAFSLMLAASGLLLALMVLATGLVLPARRGLRIAPLALLTVGPLLAVAAHSVLRL
ncbi:hypothetical protein ACIHEI_14815 [Kitasatospora sp. NPDC051984]|uniref:hypothetical protein n=1 Tax=Kitasatospora sp. NPDC051984 TaxID=3364059 RepID=UPI0037CA9825